MAYLLGTGAFHGVPRLGRLPIPSSEARARHGLHAPAARHSFATVCSALSLATEDVVSSHQSIGQSLTDHSASAAFRADASGSSSSGSTSPRGSTSTVSARNAAPPGEEPAQAPKKRRSAWNKGLRISETTRKRISLAQKRRWKEDPTLKTRMQQQLKGKVPWNKGGKLSAETRAKMSEARLNSVHRHATRNRMSRSHRGLRHSPATIATLSAKLMGRPKAAEHREAIAAGQRRRHASIRVLAAVEEVHRSTAVAEGAPEVEVHFDAARFRNVDAPSSSGLKGLQGSRPQTKTQILTSYRNALREYRALQEELVHWTKAFTARHRRKPTLKDVERTGIDWLITKYKCYVVMRDRLILDTPKLRTKLSTAKTLPGSINGDVLSSTDGEGAWINSANAVSSNSHSSGAARMSAALQHKRSQSLDDDMPAGDSSSAPLHVQQQIAAIIADLNNGGSGRLDDIATISAISESEEEEPDMFCGHDDVCSSPANSMTASDLAEHAPAAALAAATQQQQPPTRVRRGVQPMAAQQSNGQNTLPLAPQQSNGQKPLPMAAQQSNGQKPLPKAAQLPGNTPARVRSAMAAAMQYRQKRASEASAAAAAAAAAAAQKAPAASK